MVRSTSRTNPQSRGAVDSKGKRKADAAPEQIQDSDETRAAQLAQLEAFGNAFLSSFELPEAGSSTAHEEQNSSTKRLSSQKRRRLAADTPAKSTPTVAPAADTKEQDEMDHLFHSTLPSTSSAISKKSVKKSPKSRAVETVVFGGETKPDADEARDAKKGWKSFMSSKIDRINTEQAASEKLTSAEEEEEKQLIANDRLLSNLLSTTLFAPGSTAASKSGKSDLSSNLTIARILELSASDTQRGGAALGRGWGENELKRQQLAKAPAAIRQGMRKAAGERRDKQREKAKELGTWHPSMKAEYAAKGTKTEMGMKKETRKRERGLGMGIGKFQGGVLKLSKGEIGKVNGKARSGSGGKSGKAKRK